MIKMLMNSLCALAIGFVLDSLLGDPQSGAYPLNIIKKLLCGLDIRIKHAYADEPDARNAAGGMFEFLAISIVLAAGLALFVVSYMISDILGILVESIMCWTAISVRTPKELAARIMHCAKSQDVKSARKYFEQLTGMDASGLDVQDIVRCTLEQTSADVIDNAVAPVFWIGLLGGVGGLVYRTVNLADRIGGRLGGYEDRSGNKASAVNRFFSFIPAKLAAALCKKDGSLLMLDAKCGDETYRYFRNDSQNKTAAHTQSMCAGLLGCSIDSGYPNGKKMILGEETAAPNANSIYWVNQLVTGAEVLLIFIIAAIRVGLFFILR
jgi:adenosylcobinamide-phosphate synthase